MYKGRRKDLRKTRRTRKYYAGGELITGGPSAGPGAAIAAAAGRRSGRAFLEDAGMQLAGKGQELLGGIKSGKIGLGGAGAAAGAIANKLISKGSGTANDAFRTDKKQKTGAFVGGALSGAGKGFDIGNKIIPGLGGAIGAAIGAIGGGAKARRAQERERKSAVRDLRRGQNAAMRQAANQPDPFSAEAGAGFNTATSSTKAYDQVSSAKYGGPLRYGMQKGGGVPEVKFADHSIKDFSPSLTERAMAKGSKSKSVSELSKKEKEKLQTKYRMGGQKLPGGKTVPLPGGAVEFVGQKHSQGGIMLDKMTEVEGGETMDKVKMKKHGGKNSDYIFSDHLKLGGVSFAKRHKDILQRGGSQKEIQELAKMQEKKAGRTPKVMQEGGATTTDLISGLEGNFSEDMTSEEKAAELNRAATAARNEGRTLEDVEAAKAERERVIAENEAKLAERAEAGAVQKKDASGKRIYGGNEEEQMGGWLQQMENDMSRLPEEHRTFDFSKYKNEDGTFNTGAFNTKEEKMKFRDWYNSLPDDLVSGKISAENDGSDLVYGTQWASTRLLERPPEPEELEYAEVDLKVEPVVPDPVEDGVVEQPDDPNDPQVKTKKKRDVPLGALLAGASQLIPPAYALLKKPPTVPGYAPQAYAKPQLPRVNYNAERASNASDMRATMASIENNAAGPGGMVNMIAAMGKKRQGDLQIAQAESAANKQLSAEEARLGAQTSQFNIGQDAQAQTFNRQLAREQIKDRREEVLGALDAAADRIAGITGDVLDYKASERESEAISGQTKVLLREELRRQNPDLSETEIAALAAQMDEGEKLKRRQSGKKEKKKREPSAKKKARKEGRAKVRAIRRGEVAADPVTVGQFPPPESNQEARRGGYIRSRRKIRRRR